MSDTGFDYLYLVLLLVLPLSALAARRLPIGHTIKLALAWLAIFLALFGVVVLVQRWQATPPGARDTKVRTDIKMTRDVLHNTYYRS